MLTRLRTYDEEMLHRMRLIVEAAHIGPSLVVAAVSALLAMISGLDPLRVALVGLVMLLNQLSIGWSNDAIDSARDIDAHRTDKPVVRGDISARTIMALGVTAAVAAIVLSFALGVVFALVHAIALGSGWAYNAGLKRTVLATVCYIIGFGSIPVLVALAREEPAMAARWAIAMGSLMGVAAHFTNVLPDLEADRRHGVRSLPHLLGARPSGVVALVALSLTGALGVIGPASVSPIAVGGAAVTAILVMIGIVVIVRDPTSRALFRIILGASFAALVTLAGAAEALVVLP